MTSNDTPSRINLFLIELIIAIIFFVIISVIVMNVFTSSNELTVKTIDLNGALIVAQSNAEKLSVINENNISGLDNKKIYFDEKWKETTLEKNAYYKVIITVNKKNDAYGTMYYFNQTILKSSSGDTIYSLDTQKYYNRKD